MEPVWIVAAATTLAALTAALGVLPVAHGRVPPRLLGWANAAAAGLMLGAAYVLAEEGLALHPLQGMAGVLVGIGVVLATHAFTGTSGITLSRQDTSEIAGYGGRVLVVQTVHGALEGVAIGVAAVLSIELGVFLAAAFAVHNVAEGTVLCAVLRGVGTGPARAAVLAVVSNSGQVLLAVAAFALVGASPATRSVALGLATGGLVYLVMVDLLPEAYEDAGPASIALVTSLLMGVILLLRSMLLG